MYKITDNNVMDEALVIWFKNCCKDPRKIKTLDQLLQEENVKHVYKIIIGGHVEDYNAEDEVVEAGKHYLEILLDQICSFYSTYLNQIVVQRPNVKKIVKNPRDNFADTHLLFLLILGCATQCHEKFWFYEKIAQLDTADFFHTIAQLKKVKELVQEKKAQPAKTSRFLRHFSKSFNFNKQNTWISSSANHQETVARDEPRMVNCKEECPLSPIYQIKIQKESIKRTEAEEKVRRLELQVKRQNDLIDTLKKEYETKLSKQGSILSHFQKENSSGATDETKWALMEDKSKPEAELLYKIEMYNNLLNEVAKEWSKEEVKYKQLSEEITRIKRLIQFDNAKHAEAEAEDLNHNTSIRSYNDVDTTGETDCLNTTASNVPHLIEMFENKHSNQHSKVLEIKNKIFATKNNVLNASILSAPETN